MEALFEARAALALESAPLASPVAELRAEAAAPVTEARAVALEMRESRPEVASRADETAD